MKLKEQSGFQTAVMEKKTFEKKKSEANMTSNEKISL